MSNVEETRPVRTIEDLLEGMDEYQKKALEDIARHKKNVFLTGAGGCGKTYLILRLHDWLMHAKYERGAITSTTGVTALLVQGRTVSSFFGFGINECAPADMWEKHVKKNKFVRENISPLTMLVIDEVSMLSAQQLECIEYVMRQIKKRNSHLFGGVQMILCGDFLQLEPVKGQFCFKSPVWQNLNLQYHCLRGGHRQAQDELYRRVLADVRQGEMSALVRNVLGERVAKDIEDLPPGIIPTELYSRRVEAEKANLTYLEALEGDDHTYEASLQWVRRGRISDKGVEMVEKMVRKNMITPSTLMLKVGAQVMLTCNLDLDDNLANGSLGIVESFEQRTRTDEDTGEEIKYGPLYPRVKFSNGSTRLIWSHTWKFQDLIDKYFITFDQVPLLLAWACTTHKVQGCTLDFASIKMDNSMFANGMAYVALSRVRGLKYVTLQKFQTGSVRTSNEALMFYKQNNLL